MRFIYIETKHGNVEGINLLDQQYDEAVRAYQRAFYNT